MEVMLKWTKKLLVVKTKFGRGYFWEVLEMFFTKSLIRKQMEVELKCEKL